MLRGIEEVAGDDLGNGGTVTAADRLRPDDFLATTPALLQE